MKFTCLSTFDRPCGIASYTKRTKESLEALGHSVDVFPIDLQKLAGLNLKSSPRYFGMFLERAALYDASIVQHEHALYTGKFHYRKSVFLFEYIVRRLQDLGKPVLIIFHTPSLYLFRPWYRAVLDKVSPINRSWNRIVEAVNSSDKIHCFAHSQTGAEQLIGFGFSREKVHSMYHPVPAPSLRPVFPQKSNGGLVTLGIFGFVSRYKGYDTALQALTLLPNNFRLRILGGQHPNHTSDTTYADLVGLLDGTFKSNNLPFDLRPEAVEAARVRERVEVTGMLDDAAIQTELERIDIILAPYKEPAPAGSGALSHGLSACRPIIASGRPSFLEIEAGSGSIITTRNDSPQELARAIKLLAGDESLSLNLINNCRQFAEEQSWSKFAHVLAVRARSLSEAGGNQGCH